MNLTDQERTAILMIGSQASGVTPGIETVVDLMIKGLAFIHPDRHVVFSDEGQTVYREISRLASWPGATAQKPDIANRPRGTHSAMPRHQQE